MISQTATADDYCHIVDQMAKAYIDSGAFHTFGALRTSGTQMECFEAYRDKIKSIIRAEVA